MLNQTIKREYLASNGLPIRKGPRPQTIVGPLHIQCDGYGDSKHWNELVKNVLAWPHIEPSSGNHHIVRVRLEEKVARSNSATYMSEREFGRFLLAAPTIYLALPVPLAQRAIARRWAELYCILPKIGRNLLFAIPFSQRPTILPPGSTGGEACRRKGSTC